MKTYFKLFIIIPLLYLGSLNSYAQCDCNEGFHRSGLDLITNGDFEDGNSDFTSSYGYVANRGGRTELNPEGLYSVWSNAYDLHNNFVGTASALAIPITGLGTRTIRGNLNSIFAIGFASIII